MIKVLTATRGADSVHTLRLTKALAVLLKTSFESEAAEQRYPLL